ncbi:response regulator transcription factor [Sphingomonadaceae bacterium]|nr:response regulator transcription factor [Sphingomonadaceae bacterium]
MPQTVLVVDDDPHIRQLLSFSLGKAGLGSFEAENGEAALASVAALAPDLVILDINMPRMNGLDVCRKLRADSTIPILFLSSRDEEIDRILGIELGGDDYVVKPFSPREVVARVQAILRRTGTQCTESEFEADFITHGKLKLDIEGWRASWDGQNIALTNTEFTILKTLASTPRKVFSRDAIIDALHGPGFAVTDRTIDSHIRNMRAKFAGIDGEVLIETRTGIGYSMGPCDTPLP